MQDRYFALARKQQNNLDDMPVDGEVKLEDSGGPPAQRIASPWSSMLAC